MRIDRWKLKMLSRTIKDNLKYIKIATAVMVIAVAVFFFGSNGEIEKVEIDYTEKNDEISKNNNAGTDITEIETSEIICDISGEIISPGVYHIEKGKRLEDLIMLAGGLTEDADINLINRARVLGDGEKIIIPKVGESEIDNNTFSNIPDNYIETSGVININYAGRDELQEIPGVGPVTADKIIAYRTENGLFAAKEDIKNVSGIGEKTYEKMKDYITV